MAKKYLQKYPNYTVETLSDDGDVASGAGDRTVKGIKGDLVVTQHNADESTNKLIITDAAEIASFKDTKIEVEVVDV